MILNWIGIPHFIIILQKLHLKWSLWTLSENERHGQSCPPAALPEASFWRIAFSLVRGPQTSYTRPPTSLFWDSSASWHFQIPEFLAAHLKELRAKHLKKKKKDKFRNPRKVPMSILLLFCRPLAPRCCLSGSSHCSENVLLCPPNTQLFWVPVNLCPSCGAGLISHFCLYLSVTHELNPAPHHPRHQPRSVRYPALTDLPSTAIKTNWSHSSICARTSLMMNIWQMNEWNMIYCLWCIFQKASKIFKLPTFTEPQSFPL